MPDLINVTEEQIRAAREQGCEECNKTGSQWVNLRMCLNCGKVGCCDSSPNQHASKHWRETGHNLMRGIMVGDRWTYDFVTGVTEDPEYR
jgi:uncharacterized UBP type Zn finger protein